MTSDRDPIVIDGRQGEGGGQVLRTSLALAVALGQPVRIENVRAGRAKPGLQRQHLACVVAAAEISGGEVLGAELRSTCVELHPGGAGARPGTYRFGVGSAGSTLLVLQTVLAPLCIAEGPTVIELDGGTHNPLAPPFDFIARSFLPLIGRMGAQVELELLRHGFAPAGGGRIRAHIEPTASPRPLELVERGAARHPRIEITLAHLPGEIAAREWAALQRATHWPSSYCSVHEVTDAAGPGNVISVELASEHVTTICTAFGEKGVRSERVAQLVARDVKRHLQSDAPVCEHLADQLMLPLALMAGGRYRATELTPHARTNADVINAFLPGAVTLGDDGLVLVRGRNQG
jgi:RNA 3'-terminal phosphate cyclase (ATP)